jgi:hypothetical protein
MKIELKRSLKPNDISTKLEDKLINHLNSNDRGEYLLITCNQTEIGLRSGISRIPSPSDSFSRNSIETRGFVECGTHDNSAIYINMINSGDRPQITTNPWMYGRCP